MAWEFHFRNFEKEPIWFGAYHAGCGGAPWHDWRPLCWSCEPCDNPTGGKESVYAPSDWVVHFGNWFRLLVDGLKLMTDIGIFIATLGEDEEALIEAIKDAFDVTKDAIVAAAEEGQVNLGELAKNAKASFEKTCAAIGRTPAEVEELAREMGLGDNWVFIAGDDYNKYIRCDSAVVNYWGWTVLVADPHTGWCNWVVNHAFIKDGHLFQAYDRKRRDGFWRDWANFWDGCPPCQEDLAKFEELTKANATPDSEMRIHRYVGQPEVVR